MEITLSLTKKFLKLLIPFNWHPRNYARQRTERLSKKVVQIGPFVGLRYADRSIGSAHTPKLLGIYEAELHPIIEAILSLKPQWIFNLGAAEGYYAAGFAFRLSLAHVIAFEKEPRGREMILQMIERNGLGERLSIEDYCSVGSLNAAMAKASGSTVIICDVDGAERELLDPLAIPKLKDAYILVEVHDFIDPELPELLTKRFDPTHIIKVVTDRPRTVDEYPYRNWYLKMMPDKYVLAELEEYRPCPMIWYYMEPKSRN